MRSLLSLTYIFHLFADAKKVRHESSLDLSQRDQGRQADPDELLHVSVALRLENSDLGVKTLLRIPDPASPHYGKHLSAKEVAHIFEPSAVAISGF